MCLNIVHENKINHEVDRLLNDEYIVGYKEFCIDMKDNLLPYHRSKYRYKYEKAVIEDGTKLLRSKVDNKLQKIDIKIVDNEEWNGIYYSCAIHLGYHLRSSIRFMNDWWIPVLYHPYSIQIVSNSSSYQAQDVTVSRFLLMQPSLLKEYLIKKLIVDKTLYIDNSCGDNIYDQAFISNWISAYIIHYERIFNKIWTKTKE